MWCYKAKKKSECELLSNTHTSKNIACYIFYNSEYNYNCSLHNYNYHHHNNNNC